MALNFPPMSRLGLILLSSDRTFATPSNRTKHERTQPHSTPYVFHIFSAKSFDLLTPKSLQQY